MNTRSKKCLIPHIVDNLDGDKFFDSNNFFTLPNTLDNEMYVHIIQQDTCLWDIQDLNPEDIAERLKIKKKQADKRRMRRIRRAAELRAGKVKQLRRELPIAQKKSNRRWRIRDHLVEQRILGKWVQSKKIGDKKGGTIDTIFTDTKSRTTSYSPSNIPTITNLLINMPRHQSKRFYMVACLHAFSLLIKIPLHDCSNSGIWHLLV